MIWEWSEVGTVSLTGLHLLKTKINSLNYWLIGMRTNFFINGAESQGKAGWSVMAAEPVFIKLPEDLQ